jgi:hypothetical protein
LDTVGAVGSPNNLDFWVGRNAIVIDKSRKYRPVRPSIAGLILRMAGEPAEGLIGSACRRH